MVLDSDHLGLLCGFRSSQSAEVVVFLLFGAAAVLEGRMLTLSSCLPNTGQFHDCKLHSTNTAILSATTKSECNSSADRNLHSSLSGGYKLESFHLDHGYQIFWKDPSHQTCSAVVSFSFSACHQAESRPRGETHCLSTSQHDIVQQCSYTCTPCPAHPQIVCLLCMLLTTDARISDFFGLKPGQSSWGHLCLLHSLV